MMRDDLMVQQQVNGPWQMFVGCIMLNQTSRKPVKVVLPEFLERWPNPKKFLKSQTHEVIDVIRPLGFYNRRERAIRKMSEDFLTWNGENANMLYGIGKYGSDSYEIFFKKNYAVEPTDKELKRYLSEEVFNVVS